MKRHFKSIRRRMLFTAVMSPVFGLMVYFLIALGLEVWRWALVIFCLIPLLPRAEEITGGKARCHYPEKDSLPEVIRSFAISAIISWFLMTHEALDFINRLGKDYTLLNWYVTPAVVVIAACSLVLRWREATEVTDEDIYSYYTEMESVLAGQKAKVSPNVVGEGGLDSTISHLRS
jgi:hypothetical protein